MRVLVVGGTGTIGGAVAALLEGAGHRVVRAGRSRGDHAVDLAARASIEALYQATGPVDAVVCCAGTAVFGTVQDLDDEAYRASIRSKLMGQIWLVVGGLDHVPAGGSFTLTTGTLSQDPAPGSAAVAMVGGALESWAKAAALDLPDHRVNVVSPGAVRESLEARGMDPGAGTPVSAVAGVYRRAVEGTMTGQTLYLP
ncbi:MAG: short chain dehydrogenase [Longimicrobiales bacterium]